jgi:polyphosphate glucokinase
MAERVLGIDVGGSAIKAGAVDIATGSLTGELRSVATPRPATPPALISVFSQLATAHPAIKTRLGVAFPSVIKHGTAYTAANIDPSWIGAPVEELARQALGRPVLFLNDADAAGLAEMRWGAGRGCGGTVIMLTLGTGIGTALFSGGQLFPNTELGHLELRGMDAEKRASAHARTRENLDFPAWAERVNEYLEAMQRLFWPDVFILGGAVSERFAEFAPLLRSPAELRPAHFGNQAGVIGAALAAADARL